MKLILTTIVSTVAMGLVMLLSPAAALACKPKVKPVNEHCYGLAEWNVEGESGEGFKGLDAILGINEEALYAWAQEGSYNFLTDEEWVGFPKGYWNESGEELGCSAAGCTPEHEDRWFWFYNSEKEETGHTSSEGNDGPGEWEVTDKYEPSNSTWWVKSDTLTVYLPGQPSSATSIEVGTEITTNSSLLSGGAKNLDWEDLGGKWHYSDWASGDSHAGLGCISPAKAAWIEKYKTVGFGSNIEFPCDNETSDDLVSSPTSTGEHKPSGHQPAFKPASASSAAAMMPNLNATGPMSMVELKTRVTAVATNLGDPDPSSIEVAKATEAQALAVLTPRISYGVETDQQQESMSDPTYAVVLHGHFESATQTEGETPSKSYTILSLAINAKTGEITTFSLSKEGNTNQEQPAVSQLGDVSTL